MDRRSVLVSGFLLLFALLSFGCATTAQKKPDTLKLVYRSSQDQPSWISIIPEQRDYLFFVGTSSDSESFDSGKQDAVSDALAQVVAAIGISVSSFLTVEERFFAEEYTAIVSRDLLSSGRARLQDAEIIEVYHEEYERKNGSHFFRVWVLLKYSKEEIRGEQKRIDDLLKLKYGEVRRLEGEASVYLGKDKILEALVTYLNAAFLSLKLEDEGIFFDRNLQKAQEIILKMELRKTGDGQSGWVGESLPEPLSVQVLMLSDRKDVPISNVPVKFVYRIPKTKGSGFKLRVDRVTTDSQGRAVLPVKTIHEVNDSNTVEAVIDLKPFFSARLDSVPPQYEDRVKALEELLDTKRTTFIYRSDSRATKYRTAVYFLQTDLDGGLLQQPVTAPVLNEELSKRGFSVFELVLPPSLFVSESDDGILEILLRSIGEETRRILVGHVRIVDYDRISGFDTARAESIVRLYDRESDRYLGTWRIQKSGTGSSKAVARNNVLKQIGREWGEIISSTMP